jgi:hypothetical protein
LIELIHPLATSDVFFDRATGVFSEWYTGAGNLAVLRALGHLSFEGLALYPNGVLY